jgi:hypothetical protein
MAKIKVRTGRGTGTIEVDDDPSKWSGEQFRKIQESRKEAAKDTYVSTGRGTGKRKLGDTPVPMGRKKYTGITHSGRGVLKAPETEEKKD